MASPYWQHNSPLSCPKGHKMIWLGLVYWICGKGQCNQIYVEAEPDTERAKKVGVIVAAYRDAEGWILFDALGEPVEWPPDWPSEIDPAFLRERGIEVAA